MADELPQAAGDELPPGLEVAIRNAAIPMIVDATITAFTKEGHARIKVNKVYKAPVGKKSVVPTTVKGYRMDGANDRVVPIRVLTDKGKKRFLFFLKGDLLYSTYNNRFEIKKDKVGKLIVHTGREWQPLADMAKLIAGNSPALIQCFRGMAPWPHLPENASTQASTVIGDFSIVLRPDLRNGRGIGWALPFLSMVRQ
ncbi:MAG: hypothetical protein GY899_06115 [Verrucomicrobiaceae bacterium]|nr:hypothetical protein [Verrucomicrobiaceae bacterium]